MYYRDSGFSDFVGLFVNLAACGVFMCPTVEMVLGAALTFRFGGEWSGLFTDGLGLVCSGGLGLYSMAGT